MATAPKPRRGKAVQATESAIEQGAAGALPEDQQGAGSGSPLAVSGGDQGQQDQPVNEQQGAAGALPANPDAGRAAGGEQSGETGPAEGVTPPESVVPGGGDQAGQLPPPADGANPPESEASATGEREQDEAPEQGAEAAHPGEWEMPEVEAFPASLKFRNATGEPVSLVGLGQPLAPGAERVVELNAHHFKKLKSLLPALAKVRGWNSQFGVQVHDCED